MRCVLLVCAAGLLLVACSSKPITDTCPNPAITGAAPRCVLSAQCVGAHTGVQLDCSGSSGQCVCSENGVQGASVQYQDAFCAAANESALEAANGACNWGL